MFITAKRPRRYEPCGVLSPWNSRAHSSVLKRVVRVDAPDTAASRSPESPKPAPTPRASTEHREHNPWLTLGALSCARPGPRHPSVFAGSLKLSLQPRTVLPPFKWGLGKTI